MAKGHLVFSKDADSLTWNPTFSGQQPFSAFPMHENPLLASNFRKKASFKAGGAAKLSSPNSPTHYLNTWVHGSIRPPVLSHVLSTRLYYVGSITRNQLTHTSRYLNTLSLLLCSRAPRMLRGIGVLFEAPPLYRGALHLSPKMHATKNVSLLSKDAFYDKCIPFFGYFFYQVKINFHHRWYAR